MGSTIAKWFVENILTIRASSREICERFFKFAKHFLQSFNSSSGCFIHLRCKAIWHREGRLELQALCFRQWELVTKGKMKSSLDSKGARSGLVNVKQVSPHLNPRKAVRSAKGIGKGAKLAALVKCRFTISQTKQITRREFNSRKSGRVFNKLNMNHIKVHNKRLTGRRIVAWIWIDFQIFFLFWCFLGWIVRRFVV